MSILRATKRLHARVGLRSCLEILTAACSKSCVVMSGLGSLGESSETRRSCVSSGTGMAAADMTCLELLLGAPSSAGGLRRKLSDASAAGLIFCTTGICAAPGDSHTGKFLPGDTTGAFTISESRRFGSREAPTPSSSLLRHDALLRDIGVFGHCVVALALGLYI